MPPVVHRTGTATARFILASASPRRQSLLREAGYDFDIEPAGINEEDYPKEILPSDLAVRLAIAKAVAVSTKFPEQVVLAADTIVAFGDRILGKPADEAQARWMLTLLAGTTQVVITGVAVQCRSGGIAISNRVMSAVRMKPLSRGEIDRYVASHEWEGKAGGYGIQDRDPFVERMSGCLTNIVGLPMKTTKRMLETAGIMPPTPLAPPASPAPPEP